MSFKKLGYRVLVAIFGIPIIVTLTLLGGLPFVGLVLLINLLAQYEFYQLTERKQMHPLKWLGSIGTVLITLSFFYFGIDTLWLIIAGLFYVTLLIELFRNHGSATYNIAATTWGFFYPSIFFGFNILIRELPRSLGVEYAAGGRWILLMLITIWICDTAAYFIGSAWGRHKLYQRISPHKTIEGAVAGFIFAIITAYVCHQLLIKEFHLIHSLVIGLLVGVMSQIGDLVESVFKRDAGVKDTSGILPGHGGFLDRFDAPLFMAPLIYLYLRFVVF
ncbi:MAG: phosphatidate cytidylyltransferase [candidate division KSB1 bacterium]|nr:phosphatidate cytidylyltransferase [candidate division KSB1 bacterium]MDZ7335568.1 phosphatidate cytidylyltransferase [candidate division KSB1 bacterium]MDZ7356440.1 phosphatidate cytidylyltransferase [candidate division KSB1 bacterium]MDZ7401211.1 phosphatidate cytidylyltransferase [candidate division KSB1 bacterium]